MRGDRRRWRRLRARVRRAPGARGSLRRADRAGRAGRRAGRLERAHARAALRVRRRRDLQRADGAGAGALARARAPLGRAALRSARRASTSREATALPTSARSRSCARSGSRSAASRLPRSCGAGRPSRSRPTRVSGRRRAGCCGRAGRPRCSRASRSTRASSCDRTRACSAPPTGVVELEDGTRLSADVVVLCTGSWSSKLDERLAVIVPRRQVTAYFRAPISDVPGLRRRSSGLLRLPRARRARRQDRLASDPRRRDRRPLGRRAAGRCARRTSSRSRATCARLLPGAAGAPLVEADVCFYAMTADEAPVIDHLDDRTIAAAGLSGHGYKFSCVLGAIVGELALGARAVDRPLAVRARPRGARALRPSSQPSVVRRHSARRRPVPICADVCRFGRSGGMHAPNSGQ